jgi:hypothetical protein
MNYYLFLDDVREPHNVTWVNIPLFGWTIVRTYKDFVDIVRKQGLPKFVTFDHDLAFEHLPGGVGYMGDPRADTYKIPYDNFQEKTGYHAAQFMIEYCLEHNLPFPEYEVHSMNPVGKSNIKSLIESFKKHQEQITDGFGNFWSKTCPMCHEDSMEIVRPGKVQCYKCG